MAALGGYLLPTLDLVPDLSDTHPAAKVGEKITTSGNTETACDVLSTLLPALDKMNVKPSYPRKLVYILNEKA